MVEEEEDLHRLEWQRQKVLKDMTAGEDGREKHALTQEERRLQKEAQKNMTR